MIEREEYPEDLRSIDALLYGKGGRDAYLAQKVIEHKQRFAETGNADWLIHAARAVMGLSDEARAKLVRAGVVTGREFESDSLDYRKPMTAVIYRESD
jgi:hypothetical protein